MTAHTARYLDGLRAARAVVERQTDLSDLVHFERPSDFRKGILTCLTALDAAIRDAEADAATRVGPDQRYAVHTLLGVTGGRTDEATIEADSLDDALVRVRDVAERVPTFVAITLLHVEDLPRSLDGSAHMGEAHRADDAGAGDTP